MQVEVEDIVVVVNSSVVVVVAEVAVVSSRHPHQPGVLHVSVLVLVFDVLVVVDDVVVSELLLSKYFHKAQSRHSGVFTHSGTVSYFLITSSITT